MSQHASLTANRWRTFRLGQQILMIGNEMNRAGKLMAATDAESLRLAYERVLRLVDLTTEVQTGRCLRRELLRWRDLAAALYLNSGPDAVAHGEAFKVLLLLTPESALQIPHLFPHLAPSEKVGHGGEEFV